MMTALAPEPNHAATLAAALAAPSPLTEQVQRWLAFRGLAPGEWIELQALDVEEGGSSYTATKCAYANDEATLARLYQEGDRLRCPGVYTIANRIDDAVASRQTPGRWFTAKKGRSTTDRDVTHRRVIFVDVDYERPTGTAATDHQVEEAHQVAARVYADLASLLPPGALAFGHSGNGRSIFIALACLPATPELATLVKGILAALKERHETATVKIDPSVSDEKRLAPAFGTMKRKGNGEGERPHRRTALVTPPVPRSLSLAEVGDLLTALRRGFGVDATARVDKAMGVRPIQQMQRAPTPTGRAYEAIFREAKEIPIGTVLAWLDLLHGSDPVCPGCGKSGDSSVAVVENGLKCLHKSCADKGVPGREGFRTVIDLVCEAHSVTPSEAVNELAERFGTPALPEPREREAPTAKIYQLPMSATRAAAVLSPPELVGDLASLLAQLVALPPEQRAAAAQSPALLQAAAALSDTSPEYVQLRADVKRAGAAMGAWDKAVKDARPAPPSPPPPKAVAPPSIGSAPDPGAWRDGLVTTRGGGIKPSYGNLVLVLRCADAYRGRFSYNEMRLTPCLDGRPLGDADVGILREAMERDFGMEMSADNIKQAVRQVSEERRFHPVRDYLSGLKWDGTSRIEDVAHRILGIVKPPENEDAEPPPPLGPDDKPEPYTLAVRMLKAWFVSAVARAMRPGCKVDTALVLVGPQGFLKSTFFSVLGGPFFSDTAMDISGKDGLMQLHAAWIYEWGEIENVTSKKHSAEVKGFVTSPSDNFRPPYGSATTINPRSTIIVGSTNEEQFLNDGTGSRRFHVLLITRKIDIALLKEWRDQLWAEACTLFEGGYEWWLRAAEEEVREVEAERHKIEEATVEAVRRWVGTPEAQKIIVNNGGYLFPADVLQHAFKLDPGRWGRPEQTRVGIAMTALRWVKVRPMIDGVRIGVYKPPGSR